MKIYYILNDASSTQMHRKFLSFNQMNQFVQREELIIKLDIVSYIKFDDSLRYVFRVIN